VVRGAICRMSRTTLGPGESRAIVAIYLLEPAVVEHVVDSLILADYDVLATGFEVRNVRPEVPRGG